MSDGQEANPPIQEYPGTSGASTEELWDDISDTDLLQMMLQYEAMDDPETSCHSESQNNKRQSIPVDKTNSKKILKLQAEETTQNNNTFLINYTDEEVQKTMQGGHSKEQSIPSHSEQSLSLENHPKDQLSEENLTANQTSMPILQTQTKQNQPKEKEIDGDGSDQLKIAVFDDQPETLLSGDDVVTDQSATNQRKIFTPLQMFRGKYLNVTDLTSQAWCEQALVYSFTRIPTVEVDSTALDIGSSIHLARELEVHDIKTIPVTSCEDKFAIKLLNMLTSIIGLASGTKTIRELPVFGELPNSNMFVSGIIDEIKYNNKGELELIELKSRTSQREPSRAQFKTHTLQVMLYKHLFDSLVKGTVNRDKILANFCLDATKALGKDVIGEMLGLECTIFGDLLDVVLLRFQFSDLPLIDSLKIEYCYQATCAPIADKIVEMDSDWLNKTLEHYLKFWNGNRDAEGVDIEEAWKCRSCAYHDGCEWIEKKTKELTLQNRVNNSM